VAAISLSEKVLLLEAGLARRRIPHAFGGAIALAYYATPRATIDIDVNVFVPVDHGAEVFELLETLGTGRVGEPERTALKRDGQVRVWWEATPVDLFFAYDALHASCFDRRRRVPFGGTDTIHVLAAEDLVVFKVIFDRDKDWRDIAELVYAMAGQLDTDYTIRWLAAILGPDDARYVRALSAMRHGV
jgi:hypothetical protein